MKYTHGRAVYKRYIIKASPILLNREFYKNNHVEQLEEKFKEFIGVKYAITTTSARFAIHLIFKCLDFEKGKTEIIVPAFMPLIVAGVLIKCGLKPVFVDIDPRTLNIDPDKIEEKITKNTRFILIVHLHGIPCDLEKITKIAKKHNLRLIEDCAQAFNATYKGKHVGSFGYAGVISFSDFKNFSTCTGGIVLTNDKILNDRIRKEIEKLPHPSRLKVCKFAYVSINHSLTKTNLFQRAIYLPTLNLMIKLGFKNQEQVEKVVFRGRNSGDLESILDIKKFYRLFGTKYSNFQAKIGLLQFSDEKFWNRIKRQDDNVNMLYEQMGTNKFLTEDVKPSYFLCVTKVKNPKKLSEQLEKEKIQTFYRRYPNLAKPGLLDDYKTQCPVAEKTLENILYLPFKYHIKEKDMHKIIERFKKLKPEFIKYS